MAIKNLLKRMIEKMRNDEILERVSDELQKNEQLSAAEKKYRNACRLISCKEYDAALRILKELNKDKNIKGSSMATDVLLKYSYCLHQLNHTDMALKLLQSDLKLKNGDFRIRHAMIILLFEQFGIGKKSSEIYDEKIRSSFKSNLHSIIKLCKNPSANEIDLDYFRGIAQYLLGNVEQSTEIFDKILNEDDLYTNSIQFDFFEKLRRHKLGMSVDKGNERNDIKYKTHRGVFVKSKIELVIDNFYFSSGIETQYEPVLILENVTVRPDWELNINGQKIYHEHVGNSDSQVRMLKKERLYKRYGILYFCTYPGDEEDIESVIMKRIEEITHESS